MIVVLRYFLIFIRMIKFTIMINLRFGGNSYTLLVGAWQSLVKFKILSSHDLVIPLLGIG